MDINEKEQILWNNVSAIGKIKDYPSIKVTREFKKNAASFFDEFYNHIQNMPIVIEEAFKFQYPK